MESLSALNDLDGYRRLFVDTAFWTPYVQLVCRRHRLAPCESIRMGVPGTCPTFIVSDRWVVKFFGRLFEGGEGFRVEREANRLVARDPAIPAAPVVAEGELGSQDWPWPYLVYAFVPGLSLGELREQVSHQDLLRVAGELGEKIRRLHELPLAGSAVFPADWEVYRRFLSGQRAACVENHTAWGVLPRRLVEQLVDFLPDPGELLDSRPPHLIHADLTRDHLLGQIVDGRWHSLALIDFGDAQTGSLYYELVALHLDLFGADRQLLAAFVNAYGLDAVDRAGLPRKAMAASLLHRFNVLDGLPPELLHTETLEELAERLWRI
jgi:hygromycin-B 7''-O-kinase